MRDDRRNFIDARDFSVVEKSEEKVADEQGAKIAKEYARNLR